jgi:hypothetical protein
MTGQPKKIKRKKSIVLQAKNVEVVGSDTVETPPVAQRKVMVSKTQSHASVSIRRNGKGDEEERSSRANTQHVDVPDDTAEQDKVILPRDTSTLPVAKAVDLNSATVKDQVMQKPLDVDQAPPAPRKPPHEVLGEPTFKFFCYRCGQKLMVPVSWANKSYPCGRCGHDIVIPPPLVGNIW